MFTIDDMTIHLTRGDGAVIELGVRSMSGDMVSLKTGDVIRFKVTERNNCDRVVLSKDVVVTEDTTFVEIFLDSIDTKFGDIISKPKTYWYEVELNPNTISQTIIGYDINGPKRFILYPEGADV